MAYQGNAVYRPVTTMPVEISKKRSSWLPAPLYATSLLQMAIGVSVIVVQAILNNKVQNRMQINEVIESITRPSDPDLQKVLFNYYGFILGSVMALVGLICALVTICKPRNCCFLTTFSSFLSAVGIAASLCCIGGSVYYINQIENKNYGSLILNLISQITSTIEQQLDLALQVKAELIAIASLGGVNIIAVLINAALFCRAGFACCQPDV